MKMFFRLGIISFLILQVTALSNLYAFRPTDNIIHDIQKNVVKRRVKAAKIKSESINKSLDNSFQGQVRSGRGLASDEDDITDYKVNRWKLGKDESLVD